MQDNLHNSLLEKRSTGRENRDQVHPFRYRKVHRRIRNNPHPHKAFRNENYRIRLAMIPNQLREMLVLLNL
jgi:hypothetical protein